MTYPSPSAGASQQLLEVFVSAGAAVVDADILLTADTLLDLYGEDIRGRAYLTTDPLRGEMVLRPDFTVPVVQRHMETRADPARYSYAGKVFRKQDIDPERPAEYLQVGYEVFDGQNPAQTDAEVFVTIAQALEGLPVKATIGDIGILLAAVRGLRTTDARKAALLRHIWRPRRFRALLDRFGGRVLVPASRAALLARSDPFEGAGPDIGLRSPAEIAARIAALREDAATPPISVEELDLIEALTNLKATATDALSNLRDIAVDMPAIRSAVDQMAARLAALDAAGFATDGLAFEGSYGRTTLEYYDGFVFEFKAIGRADLPPVATGGRYDALTSRLGEGLPAPAVGGVIRPDLVVALRGDM